MIFESVKKKRNWSSPGDDKITNYWINRMNIFLQDIATALNIIIKKRLDIPSWLTLGRSVMIPKKDTPSASHYRPITCLNTLYKLISSGIDRFLKSYEEKYRLMQIDQRGSVQAAWILTFDWVKLRGSNAIQRIYVPCCKTSLPWAGKTHNLYRFCCNKKNLSVLSITTFATCNSVICCKAGLKKDGKTLNITIQLVLQQFSKLLPTIHTSKLVHFNVDFVNVLHSKYAIKMYYPRRYV